MTDSFHCPSCSTPLVIHGAKDVVQCTYCGASVSILQSIPGVPIFDPQIPDPSLTEVAPLVRSRANGYRRRFATGRSPEQD